MVHCVLRVRISIFITINEYITARHYEYGPIDVSWVLIFFELLNWVTPQICDRKTSQWLHAHDITAAEIYTEMYSHEFQLLFFFLEANSPLWTG